MILAKTSTRVTDHSPANVNRRIQEETETRVSELRSAGPDAMRERLEQLDWEWDIERAINANYAAVTGLGLALGRFVDRRFYVLPAVAAGFLMQHAIQGWCPPISVLRRLGFRTTGEIEVERRMLQNALAATLGGAGTAAGPSDRLPGQVPERPADYEPMT